MVFGSNWSLPAFSSCILLKRCHYCFNAIYLIDFTLHSIYPTRFWQCAISYAQIRHIIHLLRNIFWRAHTFLTCCIVRLCPKGLQSFDHSWSQFFRYKATINNCVTYLLYGSLLLNFWLLCAGQSHCGQIRRQWRLLPGQRDYNVLLRW